jgi:Mg2+ and Co2+ transporter CorA
VSSKRTLISVEENHDMKQLAEFAVEQNRDMRRLAAWAAIIAVPTMIAGVYGMNFRIMPELDWWYGYPLALALMATACGGLFAAFKRSGWLKTSPLQNGHVLYARGGGPMVGGWW